MYTDRNFPTKKALREAVAAYAAYASQQQVKPFTLGAILAAKAPAAPAPAVTFYQPGGIFNTDTSHFTGEVIIEGPHYPKPHSFYARCKAVDGVIVKVVS